VNPGRGVSSESRPARQPGNSARIAKRGRRIPREKCATARARSPRHVQGAYFTAGGQSENRRVFPGVRLKPGPFPPGATGTEGTNWINLTYRSCYPWGRPAGGAVSRFDPSAEPERGASAPRGHRAGPAYSITTVFGCGSVAGHCASYQYNPTMTSTARRGPTFGWCPSVAWSYTAGADAGGHHAECRRQGPTRGGDLGPRQQFQAGKQRRDLRHRLTAISEQVSARPRSPRTSWIAGTRPWVREPVTVGAFPLGSTLEINTIFFRRLVTIGPELLQFPLPRVHHRGPGNTVAKPADQPTLTSISSDYGGSAEIAWRLTLTGPRTSQRPDWASMFGGRAVGPALRVSR